MVGFFNCLNFDCKKAYHLKQLFFSIKIGLSRIFINLFNPNPCDRTLAVLDFLLFVVKAITVTTLVVVTPV